MSEDIKAKIAYELSQRQERAGHATTPEYNWVRACRIVEHFSKPEEDCPYWQRNATEYAEWAHMFGGEDGIKRDPIKTPSRFKEDSAGS